MGAKPAAALAGAFVRGQSRGCFGLFEVVAFKHWIGQCIQPRRQLFDSPAVVGKDDRRAVLAHEREQPSLDLRPDRSRNNPLPQGSRPDNLQIEVAPPAGIDDRDRSKPGPLPRGGVSAPRNSAQIPSNFIERRLRGRKADADEAPRIDRFKPLEQERQEHATFVGTDRVDLVDNHVRDIAQDFSPPAGEQQVQGLGRRDQDIRRLANHRGPFVARCIAASHSHT